MGEGSAPPRLERSLAEPCSARMPLGPWGMVRLAFRGRRIGWFCGCLWRCRSSDGLGLLVTCVLVVLRSFLPRGDDVGFGLRFLRPRLRHGLRRDLVAAALEDLQRDLELLRLERSQVELPREVDKIPFLLRQVHRLPD